MKPTDAQRRVMETMRDSQELHVLEPLPGLLVDIRLMPSRKHVHLSTFKALDRRAWIWRYPGHLGRLKLWDLYVLTPAGYEALKEASDA